MNHYIVSDITLTSIANAIRNKSGATKELIFPAEFIEEIEKISYNYEIWDGNYTVTPSVTSQILDTKGKAMADDVTIKQIPYYETTNLSGGYTAIIGG